jgi:hypothetical protein
MNRKALLVAAFGFTLLESTSTCLYAVNTGVTNPVTFQSSDYSRGFDPSEQDQRVWWTSVCQDEALINLDPSEQEPSGSGNYVDLNINKHVEVVFKDDVEAAKYSITVDSNHIGFIDIAIISPSGQMQITKLKITGKQNNTPRETSIYVTPLGSTPGSANAVATLKVHVLPKVTIKLGIWKIIGTTGDNDPRVEYQQSMVFPTFLLVRRAFRQACVVFDQVTGPPPGSPQYPPFGDISVNYDTMTPFNTLNYPTSQSITQTEYSAVQAVVPKDAAQVNILVVKRFSNAADGFTYTPTSLSYVSVMRSDAIATNPQWNLGAAHEVGHQLGLCTRQPPNPNFPEPPPTPNYFVDHDSGPFFYLDPSNNNSYMPGLLYPRTTFPAPGGGPRLPITVWMSQSDWLKANNEANRKKGRLPWTPFP